MSVLVLIPARGGSKSVPRKNICDLDGKPLIQYSIKTALDIPRACRTMVSTDDQEIAEISKSLGAEVPFLRPPAISRDDSTDKEFFLHAINWLQANENWTPDLIVHLRPTTPFRDPQIVEEAIQTLENHNTATALRSVHQVDLVPYKMFEVRDNLLHGYFPNHPWLEYYNLPRQRFPVAYDPNGYVDIIRPQVLDETGLLHGEQILAYIIPSPVIDIDSVQDFLLAEKFLLDRSCK